MKFLQITSLLSTLLLGVASAKKIESYYNEKEILSETNWKNMKVITDAPIHLSVLSQGNFNETDPSKYDKNYYYPASAGEGIDVYMFDIGFNFLYDEFSDINATIDAVVINGTVIEPENNKYFYGTVIADHGTMTSSAVTGKVNGVAKKANIHGIHFVDGFEKGGAKNVISSMVAALEYVRDNFNIKPNKTLFNFSMGVFGTYDNLNDENYKKLQELFNEFTENGVIIISAAGNKGRNAFSKEENFAAIPCVCENVICVGGVANFDIPELINDEIDSSFYKVAQYKNSKTGYEVKSNYGDRVDLYAPFSFHYRGEFMNTIDVSYAFGINEKDYIVENKTYGKVITNMDLIVPGTSFASPIVVGIAATIMSEYPDEKYNYKTMLQYLQNNGIKDIIQGVPKNCTNIFVNNGKKIVYDANSNVEVKEPLLSDEEEEIDLSDEEVENYLSDEEIDSENDSDNETNNK